MNNKVPVFKSWVPEWLIKVVILMMLLPSMSLFGFYTTNISATAGYYGIEPADVQFSILLFYAALASFYPLEQRFFSFFASKEYFIIGISMLVITTYISYSSRNPGVFFVSRFLQGIFNGGVNSVCITLIFNRLGSERAREMGYSIFYGLLLCTSPIVILLASLILDHYEFNTLFKVMIFMLIPAAILLVCMMNNVRLKKKIPLVQLDVVSFLYYLLSMSLIGYILVYGQLYNWLDDQRIEGAAAAVLLLSIIFVLRQLKLKRPFINLQVWRYANFRIGAALLTTFYILRGSLSIATNYFATVLNMDPIHIGILMLSNIIGIVISLVVTSRMVLMKKPTRLIWMAGFTFLLAYHIWMNLLFTAEADMASFILPLILQGIGVGTLMLSLVIFTVSSVPQSITGSASVSGIFCRFTGFSLSIALVNFFQLSAKSEHYQSFRTQLTEVNSLVPSRLLQYRQLLTGRGLAADQATKAASVLLSRTVEKQALLRYAMDYYSLLSWAIFVILFLIALFPYLNKTVINVTRSQPAPIPY